MFALSQDEFQEIVCIGLNNIIRSLLSFFYFAVWIVKIRSFIIISSTPLVIVWMELISTYFNYTFNHFNFAVFSGAQSYIKESVDIICLLFSSNTKIYLHVRQNWKSVTEFYSFLFLHRFLVGIKKNL